MPPPVLDQLDKVPVAMVLGGRRTTEQDQPAADPDEDQIEEAKGHGRSSWPTEDPVASLQFTGQADFWHPAGFIAYACARRRAVVSAARAASRLGGAGGGASAVVTDRRHHWPRPSPRPWQSGPTLSPRSPSRDPEARDPHRDGQPDWGDRRGQGELVKLGHPIAAAPATGHPQMGLHEPRAARPAVDACGLYRVAGPA